MSEILTNVFINTEIPELIEPSEDDIKKLQNDFPKMSEKEIIDNLETISKVYQNEVSSIAFDGIIEACTNQSSLFAQRSAGDIYLKIDDDIITLAEVAACLKHPFSAMNLIKQKNKSFELTEKYMKYAEHTDEKSDAFRHAIWNVVMAKEGWGLKNEKIAWANDFATAHEEGKKYDGLASEMDLHNNKVGRKYYDSHSSKKYTKILWWKIETGVNEPSYEAACSDIKRKAVSSVFVNKDQFSLGNGKNKINSIDSNSLVYIIPDYTVY